MRPKDCKWVCLALAILCVCLWMYPLKKPIESATFEELTMECGIGETRAMMVLRSGVKDVDDLYIIKGIGDKTVYMIKKRFY